MRMMVTKTQSSVHLVWFKRDLRLSDHKPLLAAARTDLPVLPLYVVEPDYWPSRLRPAGNGLLSKIVCTNCENTLLGVASPYVSEWVL